MKTPKFTFKISSKDLLEFHYFSKGKKIIPRLRKYFKSDLDYEDYMMNYLMANLDKKP